MVSLPYIVGSYVVEMGPSRSDKDIDGDIYLVKNMGTGVVEAETSSLPRAIMSAKASDMAMIRLTDEKEPSDAELMALEGMFSGMDGDTSH